MSNDEQGNKNSYLSSAASAASFVKGAVKTGKAVAGTAKGVAAGPYGIAAAALWENRKLLGKIIAASALLLMLPVLFILMLPSLVFGNKGLDDVPNGVLQDNNIIVSNIAESERSIESILQKRHTEILKKIEKEASKLGGGTEYHITDEFSDTIIYESTLIISQFCASQGNFKEINLAKLERLMEKGTKHIFSYHTEISLREIPAQDSKDKRTIIHYEYIVDYAGDEYYAENVFYLTSDQLQLSEDYASNLQIFLYDTIYNVEINPDLVPGETGNTAVDLALTKLGTPYSQSLRDQEGYFDCSSFTYWVYSNLGINLSYGGSNTAAAQGRYITENNLAISQDDLAPGDLIFYSFEINNRYMNISHVAIYCGNGYVVDASSSKGKVVYRPIFSKNRIVLCGRPYAN